VDSEESVTDLVHAAVLGDEGAWDALIERYSPLLMSVLRRYRMSNDDVRDVAQTVWLRMIENLPKLREPRALPSWIITTARNESLRVLKAGARTKPFSSIFEGEAPLPADEAGLDDDMLLAERREALLEAFAELADRERELLTLLVADPKVAYAEIAARMGMPVGSIGPTRSRILAKLRQFPSIAAFEAEHGYSTTGR
jgi:RNA polymerase sigma factor (sigma-70 family)